MFHLALLTRAAARPLMARVALSSAARPVSLPRATASFATAATKTATKPASSAAKTKKATSTKSTTTKKAATKKAAAKPKAPKKKAVKKEPKLKPWQARGPDGKLLPLPSASRPTLRTPFIIFMAERLPSFKGNPDFQKQSTITNSPVLDIVKCSKRIGEEWKSLSASEKQKYDALHEKEKAEYRKAVEKWEASLTPEDIRRQNAYVTSQRKKGVKGTTRLRDPAKPRRPNSAFFEFLHDLRTKEGNTVPATELARTGGEKWKAMSTSDRAPFEQRAAGALEQYRKDVAEYQRAKEAQL